MALDWQLGAPGVGMKWQRAGHWRDGGIGKWWGRARLEGWGEGGVGWRGAVGQWGATGLLHFFQSHIVSPIPESPTLYSQITPLLPQLLCAQPPPPIGPFSPQSLPCCPDQPESNGGTGRGGPLPAHSWDHCWADHRDSEPPGPFLFHTPAHSLWKRLSHILYIWVVDL